MNAHTKTMFLRGGVSLALAGTVTVRLIDSQGNPISGGAVSTYYELGKGSTGPDGTLIFNDARATDTVYLNYRGITKTWANQNIAANPTLTAQTTKVTVDLKSCTTSLSLASTADQWGNLPTFRAYYSGPILGGSLEMLPGTESFYVRWETRELPMANIVITDGGGTDQQAITFNTTKVTLSGSNIKFRAGAPISADVPFISPMEMLPGSWEFVINGVRQWLTITGCEYSQTAPEIAVHSDPNTAAPELTDNQSAAVDFGNVPVTQNTTASFTIRNPGTAALTISGVSFTGTHATDFTASGVPASVAARANATFSVTFTPSATGARAATLNIANNDADENPFNFAVMGNAVPYDTDGDGVPDNLDVGPNDPYSDSDSESVADISETAAGTNPLNVDSDGDGVNDAADAFPLNPAESLDTDKDGIGNNADPDDDNDGVTDAQDAFPLNAAESTDTDGDGTGNNADADDDNDGVPDVAGAFPLNPGETADLDHDGIGNNADPDDDNDGLSDAAKATAGTDPFDSDNDNDGLTDGQEVALGTNPLDGDSDRDGLGDKAEVDLHSNPLNPDTDDDGLNDGAEIVAGTNLRNPDTDDDGVLDGADPTPTQAGVPADFIEDGLNSLCAYLDTLPLSEFTGLTTPRPTNANKAQQWDRANAELKQAHRKAICRRLDHAVRMMNKYHVKQTLRDLHRILLRVDGDSSDCRIDWMKPGGPWDYLRDELELLSDLINLLDLERERCGHHDTYRNDD